MTKNKKSEKKVHRYGFGNVFFLSRNEKYPGSALGVILVWNEFQILPAELYRRANCRWKSVDIAVCEDPNVQKKDLGERALIYCS